MGDVIELRTEAQVNADYTLVVAKLGDGQLRAAAFMNAWRQEEQSLVEKAQSLSKEMDALKAPKAAPEPIPDIVA